MLNCQCWLSGLICNAHTDQPFSLMLKLKSSGSDYKRMYNQVCKVYAYLQQDILQVVPCLDESWTV